MLLCLWNPHDNHRKQVTVLSSIEAQKERLSCPTHRARKWQSWDSNLGIWSWLPVARNQTMTVTCPGLGRAVCWLRSTQKLLMDKCSSFFSIASIVYLCRMGHCWLHFVFFHLSSPLSETLFLYALLIPLFFQHLCEDSSSSFCPCPSPSSTFPSHLCTWVSSSVLVASAASSRRMAEICQQPWLFLNLRPPLPTSPGALPHGQPASIPHPICPHWHNGQHTISMRYMLNGWINA